MLFLTLVKAEEIQSTRQNWIKSRRKSDVSRKNSRSQTPSLLQGKSYNCVETSGGNAIDSKFSDFLCQFNAIILFIFISVVYPYLFMTTQEHELSKLTNSPPLTLTRLNVISYDHAAYMVIENLNKRAQLSDIIDHDNVIFIGTKIQDDKFFRIGKEESIFHKHSLTKTRNTLLQKFLA